MKVARYSFSGSIPSLSINYVAINKHLENCDHSCIKMKICHQQGCNDIWVVIAKKLLHYLFYFSNDSRDGNLTKSFTGAFFSNTVTSMFVKFKQNLKSVMEIFCNEVFIIRNTVRKGKSWFLAVICRKRSAFDLQFHLIVVLIFLKTCVKDRGDSSAWLLESKEGFD